MIRYSLICNADHGFEGWFRSSADFEGQSKRGLVSCPVCGSTDVTRGLMAPAVQTSRGKAERREPVAALPSAPGEAEPHGRQPVMVPDPAQKELLEALRELRRKVTENADYVGDRFADEARRMHHGETEHRGIYGEATAEETRALAEEGIEFHQLPVLPEERN
jgi:hypothetical protein